jgi:LacI family transcriptional regulator
MRKLFLYLREWRGTIPGEVTTIRKPMVLFSAPIDARIWREILAGVRAFSGDANGWQVRLVGPAHLTAVINRCQDVAGVIGCIPSRELVETLKGRKIPAVATVDLFPDLDIPLVCQDDEAIGRLAAEECLRRGFVHFGTYGVCVHEFARRRRHGFMARVAEVGHGCVHHSHERGYDPYRLYATPPQEDPALARWLARLPKPAAVFTLNDYFAVHFLEVCAVSGVRVPEDVAVVGVDDEPLWCDLSTPPLASVRTLGEPIGVEAARALQRQMKGDRSPAKPILVAPLSLTLRQSLDILAIDDPAMARALAFLREHAHQAVGVKHILAAAHPLSRRTLESRFEKFLGHGPGEELLRLRLQRAKEMLADPRLSIGQVAERAGLTSLKRFSCVFAQKCGMAPREFRRRLLGSVSE